MHDQQPSLAHQTVESFPGSEVTANGGGSDATDDFRQKKDFHATLLGGAFQGVHGFARGNIEGAGAFRGISRSKRCTRDQRNQEQSEAKEKSPQRRGDTEGRSAEHGGQAGHVREQDV